ncbi:MAG: DUF1778 domain-containing protein [Acidimicrobiales bacterium]
MAAPTRKSERIGIRISERQRSLLSAASEAEGTTVSEFVLRHATRAAEDVLADRRVFLLPSEAWDSLNSALDRPPSAVPGLSELLRGPTLLEDPQPSGD